MLQQWGVKNSRVRSSQCDLKKSWKHTLELERLGDSRVRASLSARIRYQRRTPTFIDTSQSRPYIKAVVMDDGTPGRSGETTPLIGGVLMGY